MSLGHRADLVGVAFDGDAEGAAEPQVCNLEAVLAVVHQQVLWLQIAVHDTVLMAVRYALYQLVHEALRRYTTLSDNSVWNLEDTTGLYVHPSDWAYIYLDDPRGKWVFWAFPCPLQVLFQVCAQELKNLCGDISSGSRTLSLILINHLARQGSAVLGTCRKQQVLHTK